MNRGSLAYQFKTADILTKIIAINGAVFLLVTIVSALFRLDAYNLIKWFQLPEAFGEFITQPWSIITYSFLHVGFWHVLFNMLWLYFFGRFILNLFSERRFLTIYLLGAISGGALFMLSYNLFPAFEKFNGTLIGASAAVSAVMAFSATYSPNAPVRIFTFNLKLWHIAVFLILWDLVRLGTLQNAGGLLAHLGGVIFGYVYARRLMQGQDIGIWFEKLMDSVANLFKPKQKKPFRKVHRNQKASRPATAVKKSNEGKSDKQKKIDAILDKIGKSGYESLSKEEKDFLFKAGNDH